MQLQDISLHSYELPMKQIPSRQGILLCLTDTLGNVAWGDIAPLPNWSQETLQEALKQCREIQPHILAMEWSSSSWMLKLSSFGLYPSVAFALESAMYHLVDPLPSFTCTTSALLMGSKQEILDLADLRLAEKYTHAKVKIGHLDFIDAYEVLEKLMGHFRLRVDVNRAWNTTDSLEFFSRFARDAFAYVEEPFANPKDLPLFSHPLGVDESFPSSLSWKELESLPTLQALVYKPTLQGGFASCLPLCLWSLQKKIQFVLSSSFESDLGFRHISSLAHRLGCKLPIGAGTIDYIENPLDRTSLSSTGPRRAISPNFYPNMDLLSRIL